MFTSILVEHFLLATKWNPNKVCQHIKLVHMSSVNIFLKNILTVSDFTGGEFPLIYGFKTDGIDPCFSETTLYP